jgi:16S rRNA (guanine966-N2)-methyltransferase
MRVVSGAARGRSLSAPLPKGVRPTTDRVKESIFDILGSMGGVVGLSVVDLFCGSGALGIEALSRGAAKVTFVDANQQSLDAVRANLASVGLDGARATLVRASLPSYQPPAGDLVLMDPPYDLSVVDEVLAHLEADTVVLESRTEPVIDERWVVHRQRRYGGTLVTVLSLHAPAEVS